MSEIERINGFVGTDWAIKNISVSDAITIVLSEYRGHRATISCYNFIGFSFVGYWDEIIIDFIKIEQGGDLVENSLFEIKKLYGSSPLPAGESKKMENKWYQLNIKLIDGNVVKVACDRFSIEYD